MDEGNWAVIGAAIADFWNYLIERGEIFGYVGAVVTVGTYSMRTMIPLRIVGICANALFIVYGLVAVGEMGLVTPDNRRTQTFTCVEAGELLVITYNQVRQLYFQNPKFGFFFLKLVTQRLLANHRMVQDRLEHALAARA